jgi:hypothetical protein
MNRGTSQIIALGAADILIALVGLFIWRFLLLKEGRLVFFGKEGQQLDVILAMIAILLAFTTFFGFLAIAQSLGKGWDSNKGAMRMAITSGILILYLFILPIATFITTKEMSQFMQTMISNFTYTVGIVISFYLGASAYVQVQSRNKMKDDQENAPVQNNQNL